MVLKRKRDTKGSAAAEAGAPSATRAKTTAAATAQTKPVSILKKKTSTPAKSSPVAKFAGAKGVQNGAKPEKKAVAKPAAKSAVPATAAAAPKITNANDPVILTGDAPAAVQIIAGSYDRTLHGVVATVHRDSSTDEAVVRFADTFLFNAHSSAVRCLALSPPSVPVPGQGQKVMLATGSTDERVNVYNLSAHPPSVATSMASAEDRALMTAVSNRPVMPIAESAKNRELGTLLNHSSSITKIVFPTRSKLLSASEDSTIAVTRTRDWSLLSTIKAPIPKEGMGGSLRRPTGDTAPPGGAPSGVNDFAVHPSMKVMISVSRGERCMRLWNLVTGKKAGVLNFSKELLRDVGEGRFSTGEGHQVVWGQTYELGAKTTDDGTDEYAVGFDRNVVVFGMDSLPRCKVLKDARTKTHDFQYLEVAGTKSGQDGDETLDDVFSVLAVATEDGRILFCSTRDADLVPASAGSTDSTALPCARFIGQLGGKELDITDRVKAFKIMPVLEPSDDGAKGLQKAWYVVSASSSGALRVWKLTDQELRDAWTNSDATSVAVSTSAATASKAAAPKQLGKLVGTYLTQDRITCVEAFVMIPRPEGVDDSDIDIDDDDSDDDDDSSDDEDEDED
ncbi:60s ribosome biogenesis protein [Ophiostoma piceae UAMH 11346]|uniref:60s ribosome biogenesis protein n=1 Tax=Ophiostoma piceae (strain UAMH 11346) TaxID=1262450 RepID=S3C062_OPHP1|nr:60s ribosome biogenesis protein [Ophiostoma piceae UAMH 11346]